MTKVLTKGLKWTSAAVLVVVPAIQVVPSAVVNEAHGSAGGQVTLASLTTSAMASRSAHPGLASSDITPEVGAVLQRSCQDCHSNQTEWPWYSRVAPVSWLVASHVKKGRDKLNFSSWGGRRPSANEFEEICDAVTNGSMPMRGYSLMHPRAALDKADVELICSWADEVMAKRRSVAEDTSRGAGQGRPQ